MHLANYFVWNMLYFSNSVEWINDIFKFFSIWINVLWFFTVAWGYVSVFFVCVFRGSYVTIFWLECKRMKSRLVVPVAIYCVCLVYIPFSNNVVAGVVGSAHDFTSESWPGGELCTPCHTPHKADISLPVTCYGIMSWRLPASQCTAVPPSITRLRRCQGVRPNCACPAVTARLQFTVSAVTLDQHLFPSREI